jgi:carbamoyltransferase
VHKERGPEIDHAYFGPEYTDKEIRGLLKENDISLQSQDIKIELVEDEKKLCSLSASEVAQGKVLGWFQGRMEWGPRALGNRSIICDPRRADMKDILNTKIKRRELFRPFAPSIHRDAVGDFFETEYDVPFMQQVFKIREEKRKLIPAVTHVDGTGRLQTVTKQQNPLYWLLIEEFRKITEIPMVLNTSFNENEPIVCRPAEALNCFLRTKMDLLVLGNYMLSRSCGKEEISK